MEGLRIPGRTTLCKRQTESKSTLQGNIPSPLPFFHPDPIPLLLSMRGQEQRDMPDCVKGDGNLGIGV